MCATPQGALHNLVAFIFFQNVAEDKGVALDVEDQADQADKVRILLARVGLIRLLWLRPARFHPQGGLEIEFTITATIFHSNFICQNVCMAPGFHAQRGLEFEFRMTATIFHSNFICQNVGGRGVTNAGAG